MKSIFTILLFIFLTCSLFHAQNCNPGGITFTNQSNLDNFWASHPGCINVLGSVTINASDINNLEGINMLVSIGGSLIINDCDALVDLSGLESLISIGGGLVIKENALLNTLSNLESLTSIGGGIVIDDNPLLSGFSGLENVSSIGGGIEIKYSPLITSFSGLNGVTSIGGDLIIKEGGDSFESFSGLEALTSIEGSVDLEWVDSLVDFTGLNALTTIGNRLRLKYCHSLVNLNGLDALTSIGWGLEIESCDDMTSLSGLGALTSVHDIVMKGNWALETLTNLNIEPYISTLEIRNNSNLIDLSGLENLNIVHDCYIIGNNDLVSLTGLENVDSIVGYLEIEACSKLKNIEGLNGLRTIGNHFYVRYNDSLENLVGLESLDTIGGTVKFYLNKRLNNFEGIESLRAISGNLEIQNNEILINLNGLEGLTRIKEKLDIRNNNSLNSLNGLENLTMLETPGADLNIYENPELVSINSLNNLTAIGGNLNISENINLIGLSAFESLTSIGGNFYFFRNESLSSLAGLGALNSIGGYFNFIENPSLPTLDGLESLNSVNEYFNIENNSSLYSISALENLDFSQVSSLFIIENESLTVCEAPGLCLRIENNDPVAIGNNTTGCNSEEEVLFGCGFLNKVSHPIFLDENENKLLDPGEPFYPVVDIKIEPAQITSFGNPSNGGYVYLEEGSYTFTFDQSQNPFWELTTDSMSYTLNVGNGSVDTIYFGVKTLENVSDQKAFIAAPQARCYSYVEFDVIAQNLGTNVSDGTLWLQIDEYIVDTSFIDTPDIIIPPNKFGWHFTNQNPGIKVLRQIELLIPGPPEFPVGDSLYFVSWVDYEDVNGQHTSAYFNSSAEVLCSFDPNDKLVNPVYPNNYALIGEDLVYTIRFQNTGNAEAYDVIIRDTLDENLDPSTFRVISSSHEEILSTTLVEGKYLTFTFHDIFLPDSTSNFEGSQGYVAYRIRAFEGIPEETIINNTAGIYFDLNPPVITNTTENVMLSTFDFDEDGFDLFVDCNDMNENINPDADEIPYNGIDENCDGLDTPVSTNDLSNMPIEIFPNPTTDQITILLPKNIVGARLKIKDFNGKTIFLMELKQQTEVDLSNLASGVYLLMIQTDESFWTERVIKM